LEKKQKFRNELQKQLLEKKVQKEYEKELKNAERKDLIKLTEKLNKEKEFGEQK
jgi:hypothetical protein